MIELTIEKLNHNNMVNGNIVELKIESCVWERGRKRGNKAFRVGPYHVSSPSPRYDLLHFLVLPPTTSNSPVFFFFLLPNL